MKDNERILGKGDRFRGVGHPVVETFVAQRIEFLRRHINFASVERVLDVRCGNDISAYYLQNLFALLSREHRLVFQYSRRFFDGLVNTLGLHIIYTGTIGWIFPNLTPRPFLPILSRFPFETRWRISNVVICKRYDGL